MLEMETAPAAEVQATSGLKKNFKQGKQLQSFYSGGKVALLPASEVASTSSSSSSSTTSSGLLLACTHNERIMFVDPSNARLALAIPTEEEVVTTFATDPSGRWLVTCGYSLLLRQWDLRTGQCTNSWKAPHKAPITQMAFSPDGAYLATGSADRTLSVWDFAHGFYTHKFKGHQGVVTCVAFHPEAGRLELYSGADDGSVRVWDLETRGCRVLQNHLSAVTGLAFVDNGNAVVSVGRDKVVNLWNLHTHALTRTIPVFESIESVCNVTAANASLADSKEVVVAIGGEKGIVSLWDVKSGRAKLSNTRVDESVVPNQTITALMSCPGTGQVVSVTSEQNIVFHDPQSLAPVKQLIGHNDEIIDVKYLHNGTHIVIATNSAQLRVFELETLSGRLVSGHTDLVLAVDVSPDGRFIASSSKDNTVRIWETTSGSYRCVATLTGHTEAVHAVAWSQGGSQFVVSGSKDKTIKMWDLSFLSTAAKNAKNAKPEAAFLEHRSVDSAAYTKKAHEKVINSMAVAPNDRVFATASQDKTIKLWDAATGELQATLAGHRRGVWHVEFSPVERCLLSASADKTVKLWDIGQAVCVKTFEGHTNSVLRASFLTHGMQVLSTSSDGTLKLWTIKTSECVNTFTAHEDRAWALAVRDEGAEIITGGGDSLISVWHDCTAADEAAALEVQQQTILREQELANCLRRKDYKKALQLAFALDRPAKVLHIFQELCVVEPSALGPLIRAFTADRLVTFLRYIRDWNTKLRFRSVAQQLLAVVLRSYPPTVICGLPDIKTVLEALIPFTDRQLEHVNRQLQNSYMIDYTLQSINLLIENDEAEAGEEGPAEAPASTTATSALGKRKKEDDEDDEKEETVKEQTPNKSTPADNQEAASDKTATPSKKKARRRSKKSATAAGGAVTAQ